MGDESGDGVIDLVFDAGGFIDDEYVGGAAEAGVLVVRDGADLTAVGEFE